MRIIKESEKTDEDMHLGEHVVGGNEVVSDPNPVGLHGVTEAIRVRAHIRCSQLQCLRSTKMTEQLTVEIIRHPPL